MTSPNTAQISKNLEFRKYGIYVSGRRHHWKITEDELGEFYSQFGEVIRCTINRQAEWRIWAIVVFISKEASDRALDSLPHHINEEKVFVKVANDPVDLTLFVLNSSPDTTNKSLQAFYSKFGNLDKPVAIGNPPMEKSQRVGFVSFSSHEDLDRALDAQPHFIDGSEVFLKYAAGDLDLLVKELPEGMTEELLNAFFSQYGRLRQCYLDTVEDEGTVILRAHLLFSSFDEVKRALEGRTYKKFDCYVSPLYVDSMSKRKCLDSIFPGEAELKVLHEQGCTILVRSLPENATLESLFKAFSKFGIIPHLELRNDGGMNQCGPYGFVSYGTKEEADKALENGPHMVEGTVVNVRKATASESTKQEADKALENVPHMVEGVTVDVREATDSESSEGEELNKAGTGPKRIAPKRPKNAYMFWMLENRAKVAGEVGKKLALKECDKRWAGVKDKRKWEKLAADDKARWEREKANA